MMNRRGVYRWVTVLVMVVGIAIGATITTDSTPTGPPDEPPLSNTGEKGSGDTVTVHSGGSAVRSVQSVERVPELPMDETVSDVRIDGAIEIDRNGNLVYNEALRRFLDFFIGLTRSPDDDEALRARLRAVMGKKEVPAAIRQEVLSILDDYLAYRVAANRLASGVEGKAPKLRQTFRELRSLRREYLGEDVADGFFASEESDIRNALERRRIARADNLTEQEKRRAIELLESRLPEHVQAVRQRSRRLVNVRQQVTALRKEGAGSQVIHQVRAEAYGQEAADRLARLDDRRQRWKQRLADYRDKKAAIVQNGGLSHEDRREAIRSLRQRHFETPQQRRRAKALDQVTASSDQGPSE